MSLYACLASRPPFVVFIACIATFAVTTLTLGIVVNGKGNDSLVNPDVFDWNTFLNKFAKLEFCFTKDQSPTEKVNPVKYFILTHPVLIRNKYDDPCKHFYNDDPCIVAGFQ